MNIEVRKEIRSGDQEINIIIKVEDCIQANTYCDEQKQINEFIKYLLELTTKD